MAIRKYGLYGKIGPARGFTWDEVRCTDGTLPSARYMRKRFRRQARNLNKMRGTIRKAYGADRVKRVSISVNSWYRSGKYNAQIGGARFSEHVAGRATDIRVTLVYNNGRTVTLSPADVAWFAKKIPVFQKGGIGVYDSRHGNFTHVDHRPNGPARWFNKG